MSIDKSLSIKDRLKRQRNVLRRAERIEELKKQKIWKEEDSVFGLPKLKMLVRKKKAKAKEAPKEGLPAEGAEGAAAASAAAAPAAAPAAAAEKKAPAKKPAKKKDRK